MKRALYAVPIAMGASMLARVVARFAGFEKLAWYLGAIGGAAMALVLCTLIPLMVAWVIQRLAAVPAVKEEVQEKVETEAPKLERRIVLQRAAQVIPVGGLIATGQGIIKGFSPAVVERIDMRFPELPPALENFKILHYTDMHLGTFVDLREVSQLAAIGREHKPDLVVLTGDMSDDLDRLLAALRLFEGIAPKHGVVASIGNHEYFRGLKKTVRAYARTSIPLMIEDSHTLKLPGAQLFIAGADDPRRLRGDKMRFMRRTVENSLDGAPSDGFKLLLSHRPEGFVPAAQAGFHLTLSGHTHGAQLGYDGRSWLENFMPEHFLWGAYRAGSARLYTSSGAGHWFPFRLGCPREVPMIVLRKGPADAPAIKTRLT